MCCQCKSSGTVTIRATHYTPVIQQRDGKVFQLVSQEGHSGCLLNNACARGKYDNYHLHDHHNRKLVYRFLRGAITLHMKYVEIKSKKEELRDYATSFIKNDQDRLAVVRLLPTIVQFRLALSRTQGVMCALKPEEKTATPAQEFDKADEEILIWLHVGIQEAQ